MSPRLHAGIEAPVEKKKRRRKRLRRSGQKEIDSKLFRMILELVANVASAGLGMIRCGFYTVFKQCGTIKMYNVIYAPKGYHGTLGRRIQHRLEQRSS